jgi:flagellar biosynthetic protein FliP
MDRLLFLAQAIDKGAFEQLAPPLQVAIFLGALSFGMAMLVSVTAFTRIIIVLSFVRRALTTQEIPPNPVILGLSLFLTLFVMSPTIRRINETAIQPYLAAQKLAAASTSADGTPAVSAFGIAEAWDNTARELSSFMLFNTREADLKLFFELSNSPLPSDLSQTPLQVLVPAFVVSELKTAFIMGFCIYIPFVHPCRWLATDFPRPCYQLWWIKEPADLCPPSPQFNKLTAISASPVAVSFCSALRFCSR